MTRLLALTHARRSRRPLAALAALLATSTLVVACGGSANQSAGSGYAVRAIFDSAAFVLPGLDVKVQGVAIGKVTSVELTPENQAAVTFVITDPGFQDFRKDSSCTIRPSALIGERYISCALTQVRPDGASQPAELPTIASGDYKGQHLLPVSQTQVPVDPDMLLAAANSSVRERFTLIIRELGTGLAGRGDKIQATLRKSNDALLYGNRVLKQLADQKQMLRQLSSSADKTLASLAVERGSITDLIKNGDTAARRIAGQQEDFRNSLASFSRVLDEVGPTADSFDTLATQLEPIVEDLDRTSKDLATIDNYLPSAASRGTKALDALSPSFKQARTLITSTETDALIDRVGRTAASAKTTASLLGLALGDFKTTGGIDYFLDTIYGLAYASNGRDATGYFLRAGGQNAAGCSLADNAAADKCYGGDTGRLAGYESKVGLAKVTKDAAKSTSKSSKKTASSASLSDSDAAATDLLLGGGQ